MTDIEAERLIEGDIVYYISRIDGRICYGIFSRVEEDGYGRSKVWANWNYNLETKRASIGLTYVDTGEVYLYIDKRETHLPKWI